MLRRLLSCNGRGLLRTTESASAALDPCSTSSASALFLLERASLLVQGAATNLCQVRTKYNYKFKKAANTPGLIFWRPSTPGQRHRITIDYAGLGVYTGAPVPELSFAKDKTGGRNATGRITVRHRGGGAPKVVRVVDYKRGPDLDGVPGVVQRIELDPNRSGFLALVKYSPEGQLPFLRYHIAAAGVSEGQVLECGPAAPIRPGNALPLRNIPLGTAVHNVELRPGRGGQMAKAANASALVQSKQERHAILKLPSGETRLILLDCRATVGVVSNHLQKLTNHGKAGARRKLGWRPSVRGIAMNPVDHPHGGRTDGGRPSCTPWGVYTKGKRTRRRNKPSNRDILVRAKGQPIEKFVQGKKWRAKAKMDKLIASGSKAATRARPVPPEH